MRKLTNNELLENAFAVTKKVEFLKTKGETVLYAKSLYLAMQWGRDVK